MTIRKGEPWGEPGALPSDGALVRTDAEARRLVEEARGRGGELPVLGLLGGDLCRTVGGRGDVDRLRGPDAMTLPVDLGIAVLDGVEHAFVAHVVVREPWARGGWWRGPVTAVMNAQWLGSWDVAPRSHPNDGLLDRCEGDLSLDDRWKARGRLPSGTHVPHPGIAEQRSAEHRIVRPRPTPVWLDGELVGTAREIVVTVEPDALRCVV